MTANGHVSDDGVRRSRLFLADRIVFVDGLAVTNPLDTVADLGHYADADQVELALESVLRGNDPRRPDVWHQDRFTELVALAQVRGSKGRAVLLQVLRRRGDVVPTGSAAETIAAIAFRENGVVLSRQVRVRIFDRRSRLWQTYWLDFADISRRLAIEIDGRLAHNSSAAVQRDYRRDNVLSSVFTVLRFTASEVARDPAAVADAVQRRAIETPPVCGSFRTDRGFLVTPLGPGADRVDIVDPAL